MVLEKENAGYDAVYGGMGKMPMKWRTNRSEMSPGKLNKITEKRNAQDTRVDNNKTKSE